MVLFMVLSTMKFLMVMGTRLLIHHAVTLYQQIQHTGTYDEYTQKKFIPSNTNKILILI